MDIACVKLMRYGYLGICIFLGFLTCVKELSGVLVWDCVSCRVLEFSTSMFFLNPFMLFVPHFKKVTRVVHIVWGMEAGGAELLVKELTPAG